MPPERKVGEVYKPAFDKIRNGVTAHAAETLEQLEKYADESNADIGEATLHFIGDEDEPEIGEFVPSITLRVKRFGTEA